MNTTTQSNLSLYQCHLLLDGNAHCVIPTTQLPQHSYISEALIPEIRTIATLIAAKRHHFQHISPQCFTDNADWLAARILVLHIRYIQLPNNQHDLLDLANQRAKQFAEEHQRPFQAAQLRPCQQSQDHILIVDCFLDDQTRANLFKYMQIIS